jgi:hypothetical protein
MSETTEVTKIESPAHWKHEGKTLGLRVLGSGGKTHGGFQNPLEVGAEVFAPDFKNEATCGNGLHWVPWGMGHDGQEHGIDRRIWQVIEPLGDVVAIEAKAKSYGVRIVHVGPLAECMKFMEAGRIAYVEAHSSGSASSTGYSGSASSTGDRGSASSTGYSGSASSTGDRGSASSTGDSGSASSTGYSGSASSTGSRGSASSTGSSGSASVTGLYGQAQAGPFGCICLAWWNEDQERGEMRCAEVGIGDGSDGKLKAKTWYRLDQKGRFVEVE